MIFTLCRLYYDSELMCRSKLNNVFKFPIFYNLNKDKNGYQIIDNLIYIEEL